MLKIKINLYLLILIILTSLSYGATLHGTIYDKDFDKVSNIIIEINSTPIQRQISRDGDYSFELKNGDYKLIGFINTKEGIEIIAEETVIINSEDAYYRVDLFTKENTSYKLDHNLSTNSTNTSGSNDNNNYNNKLIATILILTIIIIIITTILIIKSRKKKKEIKPVVEFEVELDAHKIIDKEDEDNNEEGIDSNSLSKKDNKDNQKIEEINTKIEVINKDEDLLKKRIIKMIDENNNLISQKEIRKNINLSESKISETIKELVKEGIILKVKKGRVNYLSLKKEKEEN